MLQVLRPNEAFRRWKAEPQAVTTMNRIFYNLLNSAGFLCPRGRKSKRLNAGMA